MINLHLIEMALILLAGRLVFVWLRPFRPDGKRRLGAGWASRLHLVVAQMISEWRAR